jgi:hypothetical protein
MLLHKPRAKPQGGMCRLFLFEPPQNPIIKKAKDCFSLPEDAGQDDPVQKPGQDVR